MTRFGRSLVIAIQFAILVCVFVGNANANTLQFDIRGTFDMPSGIYPLAAPPFEVVFYVTSDPAPGDLINYPVSPVALYSTAVYTNNNISTLPLANTYLVFNSALNGGGLSVFLSGSPLFPSGGLAIQFELNMPQLYSGTFAAPHFSPGTVNLDQAIIRAANQGPGNPLSNISNGVLTITAVPEPSSFVLLITAAVLLAGVFGRRNTKKCKTSVRSFD